MVIGYPFSDKWFITSLIYISLFCFIQNSVRLISLLMSNRWLYMSKTLIKSLLVIVGLNDLCVICVECVVGVVLSGALGIFCVISFIVKFA